MMYELMVAIRREPFPTFYTFRLDELLRAQYQTELRRQLEQSKGVHVEVKP